MEDQHVFQSGLLVGETLLSDHSIFAIFDGHGGGFTSLYLKDNFVSVFCQRPELQKYAALTKSGSRSRVDCNGVKLLKEALCATFVEIDDQLRRIHEKEVQNKSFDVAASATAALSSLSQAVTSTLFQTTTDPTDGTTATAAPPSPPSPKRTAGHAPVPRSPVDRSGSTAVVVVLAPHHIMCANAGDSRAILRRHGCTLPLSFDHKPSHVVERKRIERAGGTVKRKRVDGDLAVSRAFGDFCMKENPHLVANRQKVIVHPDCVVYPRDVASDEYIILACDGVWDVATNEQCSQFVQNMLSEGEVDFGTICEEALDRCLEHRSRDNMTMMLVGFPANLKADRTSRAARNNALLLPRRPSIGKSNSKSAVVATSIATGHATSKSTSKPTLYAF
jgi:serine/threonine protein phosphatase PrpC